MRTLIALSLTLIVCSSRATFDEARWKNADLSGRARAEMLDDFLAQHRLKGMTRAEVVALLGEPTPTDKWDGAHMIYVLGNDGSYFGIDHAWLLIDLDARGRVASYRRTVV